MAGSRGLFVKQYLPAGATALVGTSPVEARRALAGLFQETAPGVPRSGILDPGVLALVAGTSGMSYTLGACQVVVNRTQGEGVYLFSFQGSTSVPTGAVPAADSRWDLVYVKQNDVDKGDPDNLPVLGVVQGVPGPNPAKPYGDPLLAPGSGALVVAEARIYAGTTATNQQANTLLNVWPYAALKGSPVKVRNAAERDAVQVGPTRLDIERLDKASQIEHWTGTKWEDDGDTGYVDNFTYGNGFNPYTGNGYYGVRYRIIDGAVWLNGAAKCDLAWDPTIPMFKLPDFLIPSRKIPASLCVVDISGNVYPTGSGKPGEAWAFAATWPLG